MRYRVGDIGSIGQAYGKKLGDAGIVLAGDLLRVCGTAGGRKAVAADTGIDEAQLLKWASLADLMRIAGIGRQFSELLVATGVETVRQLGNRNADRLAADMRRLNAAMHLAHATPSVRQVARWVEQAKGLKPSIKQ